jgi:hypothetical protein
MREILFFVLGMLTMFFILCAIAIAQGYAEGRRIARCEREAAEEARAERRRLELAAEYKWAGEARFHRHLNN